MQKSFFKLKKKKIFFFKKSVSHVTKVLAARLAKVAQW
jgi:hypothetical protein